MEFRLTLSTLRGLTGLAVCLGFVCWERSVLGTEVVGDDTCTGSPGLLVRSDWNVRWDNGLPSMGLIGSNLFDKINSSRKFNEAEWYLTTCQFIQCQLTFESCKAWNETLPMSW